MNDDVMLFGAHRKYLGRWVLVKVTHSCKTLSRFLLGLDSRLNEIEVARFCIQYLCFVIILNLLIKAEASYE